MALASVFTGAAIANDAGEIDGLTLALLIATTILLQVLSNLSNDYGDSQHGADNAQRVGPSRTVQSGAISASSMKKAIAINAALALLMGLIALYRGFFSVDRSGEGLIFLGLGLAAILAAIKYTAGSNPYGYQGLGDLAVLVFFGWIGVFGTAYFLGTPPHVSLLLPATAIGAFATAVLNLNNLRDHINDAQSGKRTLVVKMGFEKAKAYQAGLFVLGWGCLLTWLISGQHPTARWFIVVAMLPHGLHLRRVINTNDPAALDPELKKIALSSFAVSLVILLSSLLSH